MNRLPPETEAELLLKVLQLARLAGWKTAHFRPARTEQGWRTAVQGDGKGWPDLVLVRREKLLFVELKRDAGRTTADQEAWMARLRAAGQDVRLWRPADWAEIESTLRDSR